MGKTLINLIQKYGIVGYDAMRKVETPAPRWVFMLGATYTPQEFARSVCAPDEYIALTSNDDAPYGQEVEIDLPDNWMHDRFYNIPMDSLLAKTERAVRRHHGVCWESERHAMAIVGIAHDDKGEKYFIMKNSWGTDRPHQGLDYLSRHLSVRHGSYHRWPSLSLHAPSHAIRVPYPLPYQRPPHDYR